MLLLNGHLLPTAALPLPNRGFTFGDGFFETLIFAGGQLRFGVQHFARMQAAAAALYLELPEALASAEQLELEMGRLAAANELTAARVRLQIWRAGGASTPRKHPPPNGWQRRLPSCRMKLQLRGWPLRWARTPSILL
ncbi:hypothetical protein LRS06_20225 [Hymenobacter sp. J193]|nr:aminotransferase class IV [Hymenobacter sp. J193]MCR5890057.1 hypothetical protein [Hymenobacter sp. J193]